MNKYKIKKALQLLPLCQLRWNFYRTWRWLSLF